MAADAQRVTKPQVLAYTLVHHLFVHAAATRVSGGWAGKGRSWARRLCLHPETRLGFMQRYAEDRKRLAALQGKDEAWFEEETTFFDTKRSRAWVMTRRIAHTSHHRGQQMAMLRMLGRDLHSNYGPTADTGGLMANRSPTIYAYPSIDMLLKGETSGGQKQALPGSGGKAVTERP